MTDTEIIELMAQGMWLQRQQTYLRLGLTESLSAARQRALTLTTEKAHSKLGASSMHRWANCPGSVREAEKAPPRIASQYAEEGSDAHAYAAMCLTRVSKSSPPGDVGRAFKFDGRDFTVTEEMHEAVAEYVGVVMQAVDSHAGNVLLIEQRFDLSRIHPGCFGTADAVVWQPVTATLVVFDFKYGSGIPVKAPDNPQLMYYALGALLHSQHPVKRIRMVIVQPRCRVDVPREHEIDSLDLLDFAADLKGYAKATEEPDAPLVPGDWCGFCPASGVCPALRERALEAAREVFRPVENPTLPVPFDIATLARALDSRDVVKTWLKAVDELAYTLAEAGQGIPGYKLVAKRATRKFRNEGDVVEHLRGLGLKDDAIFEPRSLKSPAQLEKGVVKKGALDEFIVAESSGRVLVPDADPREAVKVSAQDVFSPIDENDLTAIPDFLRRNAGQ